MQWLEGREKTIVEIASVVKAVPETAAKKVQQLMAKSKQLEKELERIQAKLAAIKLTLPLLTAARTIAALPSLFFN
jgi:alanyl-tRNA synthetase